MTGPEITRREYLLMRALAAGAAPFAAMEAVASVAIEHPEWDLAELRTWMGWEEAYGGALDWPEPPRDAEQQKRTAAASLPHDAPAAAQEKGT